VALPYPCEFREAAVFWGYVKMTVHHLCLAHGILYSPPPSDSCEMMCDPKYLVNITVVYKPAPALALVTDMWFRKKVHF
jgi:hypothetical protein